MGAGAKLLLGLVLLVVGLYLIAPSEVINKPAVAGVSLDWWDEFLNLLQGAIPPFLILLGVLIVWIEGEELKAKPTPPPVRAKKGKK